MDDALQAEIDVVVSSARSGEAGVSLSAALIEQLVGRHDDIFQAVDLARFVAEIGGLSSWAQEMGLGVADSLPERVAVLRAALNGTEESVPMVELYVLTASDGEQCLVLGRYALSECSGEPSETIGVFLDRPSVQADLLRRGIVRLDLVRDEDLSEWLTRPEPTLESLQEYCREKDRVCPMPMRWKELYDVLPDVGDSKKGGLPLILDGWWYSSNVEKMGRLQAHLRWAEEHGALQEVDEFLRGLPESEWHHLTD